MTALTESRPDATTAVAQLIRYLETGVAAEGLFARGVVAALAVRNPPPGRVRVARVEPTGRGFTMEFEDVWEDGGRHRSSREMLRADVVGSTIVEIALYGAGETRARRA